MDFDPGECYDDSYEDSIQDNDYTEDAADGTEFDPELDDEAIDDAMDPEGAEVEYDDIGNAVLLTAAAGFGYHMSQEELEERKLAEDILKRREGKQGEPVKIPLSQRHTAKGHMTPFGRWATQANIDPTKSKDEIQYTLEEQLAINKAEGEGHE